MSNYVKKTEVLQEAVIDLINDLFYGKAILLWKAHLTCDLSLYNFNQAMLGRPVSEETVTLILAALEEETSRLWQLMKKEFSLKEVIEYAKPFVLEELTVQAAQAGKAREEAKNT
jgi:hypothetical protein